MRAKEKAKVAEGKYACRFQPEPEGGYTVTCPALPSVVSFGESLDEARTNAREAIELCLEVFHEQGQPIPPSDADPLSPSDELVTVKLPRA
jgi:antitoxin HicB